ncbi:30S ribosomal protein S8 [Candidatus Woesearchaeota archaeon]|nr:30S ribosomal protein S8 [Candidatus Woesearchaeota archaeon]
MTLNDTLSIALSKIGNAERVGKRNCTIKPVSKVIKNVLRIMSDQKYIGTYEEVLDRRGGLLNVQLAGNINKCGTIKPRFSALLSEFEKWEKRYLPASGFGILIISTPKGIMTHEEAKQKRIGGKLLAYCY